MKQETMNKEQFLEELNERLNALKEKGLNVDVLQSENPWSISVSIGKEGMEPQIIDITMCTHVVKGYETGFSEEVVLGVELWPELVRDVRNGTFDTGLFLDMASFAFEKLIEGANEETVSRRDAYLALKLKEFADIAAKGSEELAAAQLVAEALSTQACGGWQKIDGEILTDKLAVFKNDKWVLVDMRPCDLSALI